VAVTAEFAGRHVKRFLVRQVVLQIPQQFGCRYRSRPK
jgi:hypothetical protein